MEVTLKILSRLNDFVKENEMKLLIVEGVHKDAVDSNRQKHIVRRYGDAFDFEKVTRILQSFSDSNNIAFMSLPSLIRKQGLDVNDFMHPADNLHFNNDGVLFFSRSVVEKLNTLGWVREK